MSRFINTELKSDSDLYSENDDDELMNYFCGMVDRRKAFSLISSRDHCQILTIANLRHAASRV